MFFFLFSLISKGKGESNSIKLNFALQKCPDPNSQISFGIKYTFFQECKESDMTSMGSIGSLSSKMST